MSMMKTKLTMLLTTKRKSTFVGDQMRQTSYGVTVAVKKSADRPALESLVIGPEACRIDQHVGTR
eukprot:2124723-Prymnesium_polylepis.1